MRFLKALTILSLIVLAGPAAAQGTSVNFGALKHDTSGPVEIAADALEINQSDGTASFAGNVLIAQGDMRLSAQHVTVIYAAASEGTPGKIETLIASGGVTLVSGSEAAEAQKAEYTPDSGLIVMTGSVILTQGQSAISAEKMVVNLNDGTGTMQGRVRTVLQTGNN